MNARPTYKRTEPITVGPFNSYDRQRAMRRATYDPSVDVLPATFNAPDHVSPQAVASIHKAFTQSKVSHDNWRSYKREGRLDPRRAAAGSRREMDIFQRKMGKSTTRVKVSVLIDASGSMRYSNTASLMNPNSPTGRRKFGVTSSIAAAVFGATIARALGRIPTVDLDVFEHSAGVNNLILKWRWHRGTPLGVFNETPYGIGGGGNADGHALYAITTRLLKTLKRGERGLIMLVSDGMPSQYSADGKGQAGQALIDAVAFARKNGIEVIAVAVDGSDQSVYYGKDGVVPFTGDWSEMGKALAVHVGKALAPHR